jgi:Flp pilus assembly protein TadD
MRWDLQVSPDEVGLLMEVGFICRYTRRFAEAREVFGGVRALRPQSEIPMVALGTVAFDQGQFEAAIVDYQKAIQINPQSSYAYAHLGEAQIFNLDHAGARISLKKALEFDRNAEFTPFVHSLLALMEVVK